VERAVIVLKPDRGGVEGVNRAIFQTPPTMSTSLESSIPSDIRLLLRADAEQCWLHREVIPVLREVEAPERLDEEEVGAALAYLEAMWGEATSRARETDAAHSNLCRRADRPEVLEGPASRYHAAVRVLRKIVADRVRPFVEQAPEIDRYRSERDDRGLRVTDKHPDGCPRAA
jgi:uncharacterized protein (DUF3084 family)